MDSIAMTRRLQLSGRQASRVSGFGALVAAVILPCLSSVSAHADHKPSTSDDPSPEHHENWRCRNTIEISCSEGSCTSQESFTPMDIEVAATGQMTVCAYSGCWEGESTFFDTAPFLIWSGRDLAFSTSDTRESILMMIDARDSVGLVKVGTFAQPVICEPSQRPTSGDESTHTSSSKSNAR